MPNEFKPTQKHESKLGIFELAEFVYSLSEGPACIVPIFPHFQNEIKHTHFEFVGLTMFTTFATFTL